MVLERQPQQINRNINEIYFNNIKETITMEPENRKKLHYETYRAQASGNCYKILISQEQLYAPAKFRTKVMDNTTMDNINREITLLRERQINWTEKIENMDT